MVTLAENALSGPEIFRKTFQLVGMPPDPLGRPANVFMRKAKQGG